MNNLSETFSWKDHIPVTFTTLLFILQIIVGIYLLSEVFQVAILAFIGIVFHFFSGMLFGMLPVFEFRKKGGVKNGQSYIHTTKLVNTGIYSIVRHPQYVTFILFAISGILLFQHWIVVFLGIPIIPLTYFDLIKADKYAIEKFGDQYKHYMEEVPRANFILGIIRYFHRKSSKSKRDHNFVSG